MPKKKTAATKTPAAGTPAAGTKSPPKKAAAKKAVTPAKLLSDSEIGSTAGNVWCYLSDNGPTSLAALKKNLPDSNDFIIAAIGWLAREDKLDFQPTGRTLKIALK